MLCGLNGFSSASPVRRSALFTYGWKLGGMVAKEAYGKDFSVNLSFRLPDHYILFQAEVVAIKSAVADQEVSGLTRKSTKVLHHPTHLGAWSEWNRRKLQSLLSLL